MNWERWFVYGKYFRVSLLRRLFWKHLWSFSLTRFLFCLLHWKLEFLHSKLVTSTSVLNSINQRNFVRNFVRSCSLRHSINMTRMKLNMKKAGDIWYFERNESKTSYCIQIEDLPHNKRCLPAFPFALLFSHSFTFNNNNSERKIKRAKRVELNRIHHNMCILAGISRHCITSTCDARNIFSFFSLMNNIRALLLYSVHGSISQASSTVKNENKN